MKTMITGYIDAHAHLADDDFRDTINEVIHRAQEAGVGRICLIATSLTVADHAFELAAQYPDLFDIAIGFHPSDIRTLTDKDYDDLECYLKKPGVVAVGEIGLDYHWQEDNKPEQKVAFIRQIDLANKLQLPIEIHSRDALQETLDVVKAHRPIYGGIMHCYSGSAEMAEEFVKAGLEISLGGPLTFKNAVHPKEVVQAIPIEHLFSETDSPYLTPHPFRGKPNESKYVVYVTEAIAELKGLSVEETKNKIAENYTRLFHQERHKD